MKSASVRFGNSFGRENPIAAARNVFELPTLVSPSDASERGDKRNQGSFQYYKGTKYSLLKTASLGVEGIPTESLRREKFSSAQKSSGRLSYEVFSLLQGEPQEGSTERIAATDRILDARKLIKKIVELTAGEPIAEVAFSNEIDVNRKEQMRYLEALLSVNREAFEKYFTDWSVEAIGDLASGRERYPNIEAHLQQSNNQVYHRRSGYGPDRVTELDDFNIELAIDPEKDAADCAELYAMNMMREMSPDLYSKLEDIGKTEDISENLISLLQAGGMLNLINEQEFQKRIREGLVFISRNKEGKLVFFCTFAVVKEGGRLNPSYIKHRYLENSNLHWDEQHIMYREAMRKNLNTEGIVCVEDMTLHPSMRRALLKGDDILRRLVDSKYKEILEAHLPKTVKIVYGETFAITCLRKMGAKRKVIKMPQPVVNLVSNWIHVKRNFALVAKRRDKKLTVIESPGSHPIQLEGYWNVICKLMYSH